MPYHRGNNRVNALYQKRIVDSEGKVDFVSPDLRSRTTISLSSSSIDSYATYTDIIEEFRNNINIPLSRLNHLNIDKETIKNNWVERPKIKINSDNLKEGIYTSIENIAECFVEKYKKHTFKFVNAEICKEIAKYEIYPDCMICIENIPGDMVIHPCCRGFFCKECLVQWYKQGKTCPLCRNTDRLSIKLNPVYRFCTDIKENIIEKIEIEKIEIEKDKKLIFFNRESIYSKIKKYILKVVNISWISSISVVFNKISHTLLKIPIYIISKLKK